MVPGEKGVRAQLATGRFSGLQAVPVDIDLGARRTRNERKGSGSARSLA